MHRYGLRDLQWLRIKDLLPGSEGHVGGAAPDNRLFVDAVIFRYRMLARDADNEFMMLDATSVRAHQHSTGAQKKMAKAKPPPDQVRGSTRAAA